MRLGVSWYPEQHPRERWSEDVARMAGAGLELVRMGEFAWGVIEPERDRFEWKWLDEAIELAQGAGLRVVLGTPTAAPPIWLCLERPEIMTVGPTGERLPYGGRRFTCPTSAAYREESRRIVTALAERYGSNPAVEAWQLDNEPGHHGSWRCCCDESEAAFQRWLERRYGTIEELNQAWGTVFWSGIYPSFETVKLPRDTPAAHNPSLLLAHQRFSSAEILDGLAEQKEIVERLAPGRQVLVNLPAHTLDVDHCSVARLAGVAAVNVYPAGVESPAVGSFLHDLAVGHTGRAWVMEHQPGPVNWTAAAESVAPGQVRLWGWRAALHGMETLLFFSWRPTRSGSEQYHGGLLRHDGSPDRALGEVSQLARELRESADLLARPAAKVAVLWSIDDHWAIGLEPRRPGLTHLQLVVAAHAAARQLGLEVDVRSPEDDLTDYHAVLAPALYMSAAERLASLRAALEAGVLVVLGARSLVKDMEDCWLEEPLPGGLAAELGAQVVESHAPSSELRIDPLDAPSGSWIDVLELTHPRAEVLATYGGEGYLDGCPAAVRNGNLVYAGFTSTEAWIGLLRRLLGDGLELVDVPDSRERFQRDGRVIELDHDRLEVSGAG
ncbi:MAG TPA: beta-galactosidase [Candidatus Limnocylindria bacterium]|nr:beta-galactosidase [Candidatus Limnocylindria bacterium]